MLTDPADPSTRLLIDGIGLFAAELRELIQEPAGHRPISRGGADTLDLASDQLLGGLRSDLPAMFDAGCDRLVICPHGPLAFIPFHLLPAGNKLLADYASITVLPALGTALAPRCHTERPGNGTSRSPLRRTAGSRQASQLSLEYGIRPCS